MAGDPLAAVVLDALGAPRDAGLDHAVGAGAAQRLRAELRAVARRWVADLAPGRAFEATTTGAAAMALHDHAGPVVLIAPDVPMLSAAHAALVTSDLADGVGLLVAASHDASPYLFALPDADPDLIDLAVATLPELLAAAAERQLAVAVGRPERRLVSADDARALAVDPLAPAALVAQLGNLRSLVPRSGASTAEIG